MNEKKTPLYEEHLHHGAKMAPFAGHLMPIQYPEGTLAEYRAVRESSAGLFDISHMGEIQIEGENALSFLQYVTCNDVEKLACGQVQYSALLNEKGGFIDDVTIYRLEAQRFLLCVNATNRWQVLDHLKTCPNREGVCIHDASDNTALLAIQGPLAQAYLAPLTEIDLERIEYYCFAIGKVCGYTALVSRTGYTGEDGFELFLPVEASIKVWRALIERGAHPAGLACRDMLRIEMGYALYGHEIGPDITPLEAGLRWIVKFDKGEFIGRHALLKSAPSRRLIGLVLDGRGVPRPHYPVLAAGKPAGEITSGAFSPLLGRGIALAFLNAGNKEERLAVQIRNKTVPTHVTKPPFVRSNVRRKSRQG